MPWRVRVNLQPVFTTQNLRCEERREKNSLGQVIKKWLIFENYLLLYVNCSQYFSDVFMREIPIVYIRLYRSFLESSPQRSTSVLCLDLCSGVVKWISTAVSESMMDGVEKSDFLNTLFYLMDVSISSLPSALCAQYLFWKEFSLTISTKWIYDVLSCKFPAIPLSRVCSESLCKMTS